MISWFKSLFKKENNEEENYSFDDFSSDLYNIKNKNSSVFLKNLFWVYSTSYIFIGLSIVPILLFIYLNLSNVSSLFLFLFGTITYLYLSKFIIKKYYYSNGIVKFFVKKIYKKIKNKKLRIDAIDQFLFKDDQSIDYILKEENNIELINNFNKEEKIKAMLFLNELNFNFNKNIYFLKYIDNYLESALINMDFKNLLNRLDKKKLYEMMNTEIIDYLKSTENKYDTILEELFGNEIYYQKDKKFYRCEVLNEINNNLLNNVVSF